MKPFAFALLFSLLNLMGGNHLFAATYFVNSNDGNDAYNGSMPAASGGVNGPWQTLTKLASVALAPNDTVYLACGSVWNETLKVSSSGAVNVPISIAAGPRHCDVAPLIDGAVSIPGHQWVRHSGSIYKAKLPIDLISNPNPRNSIAGWGKWSASGDAGLALDSACPAQALPCMAFTAGVGASIAISNSFPLAGGVEYIATVQLLAPAGVQLKVVLRRDGPTYENVSAVQYARGTGTWQTVTFSVRAGSTLANARLDIEVPGARTRINVREAHVTRTLSDDAGVSAFVDGLMLRRAHHPNFGQSGDANSPYASIASAGGKTTLDASALTLPAGASLTTGLGVTMRTINWAIEERTVASVNGSRLTLSGPTGYDTLPGYGFFLTGALWMLDSPGEWFFDAPTSTLYVWMPDSTVPGTRVSIGDLPRGIDLREKANITIKDIAIRHAGIGASLGYSSRIVFSGMALTDMANYGIDAINCGQCTVQGSRIARTGLDAINIPGNLATDFKLLDSSIADSGAATRTDGWRVLPRPAFGAVHARGMRPSILRNTISGTGNAAAFLGPDAVVADNHIANTCLALNDCGAVYTNYTGNNATIRGNVIENVVGNLSGLPATPQAQTVGIYLDDHNANSTVSGNTVTGAAYGVQLHNANGATVSNNVLFGNQRHQLWLQEHTATARSTGDVFGNAVMNNLMVPAASGPALYLDSEATGTTDFATFSGNHYSALLSARVIGERSPTTANSYSVADWQAAGRETGAHVTQPVGYATFLAGATNLIPNGNLASGKMGWTSWNLTPPLTTAVVSNCGFAPCIQMNSGASVSLLSSWNFSVVAGQWYRVTFDAKAGQPGQAINAVVRRGGGGTAGYEYLMPAVESFAGTTTWRRYTFTFQAIKTVTAGDPVTQERGARVDFDHNLPGSVISIARLEMVAMTPAQAALQVKLLVNRNNVASNMGCAEMGVADSLCESFVYMNTGNPVTWPAPLAALSGSPVYTRDTSLTDSDGDGIADQQDACPSTLPGLAVNARGCAFSQ